MGLDTFAGCGGKPARCFGKNRMTNPSKFAGYAARLRAGIHQTHCQTADRREGGSVFPQSFEAFALELFAQQFEANTVYRRFCEGRSINPGNVAGWREI